MMKHTTRVLAALWLAVVATGAVAQDCPEHSGKIALFRTLHAHSVLSGYRGTEPEQNPPPVSAPHVVLVEPIESRATWDLLH